MSRVRASAFANRSSTVPQGYLISAVLETGFDSTKPGFARAMVSRDVRGFDGKYILIPRGSRLIGEYRSDIGQSQKRAIITWTRLIRPDGMTIALDSPAADTLGRGGVDASVNTHFFQRLGDALLQSTFEIGRAFAGRAVTGPVVVVSGSTTAAAGQLMPMTATNYVPTLTVAPGKSISVFVAHDLDFSAAGAVR
jgi:type IV secretion system protein VirB10